MQKKQFDRRQGRPRSKQTKAIPHRGDSLFYLVSIVGILVSTLLISPNLADISNMPRFIALAATLSAFILVHIVVRCKRGSGTTAECGGLLLPFLLWQFASIVWATNKGEAIYDASRWLMAAMVVLVSAHCYRRHPAKTVVLLARLSAIVFIASAGVALVQVSELDGLTWDSRYSVVSLFTHKGTFAMMVLLTMVLPLMHIVMMRRRRWLYVALVVSQLAMLVLLQARAVLLALVAMIVAVVIFYIISFSQNAKGTPSFSQNAKSSLYGNSGAWKRALLSVAAALVMGVAIVGACRWFAFKELPGPDQSGGLLSNASLYERQALWRTTFRMVDESPALGCGVGNWKICYPKVGTADIFSVDVLDFVFVRPHNEYLRLLSETGYIGLFLLLLPIAFRFVSFSGLCLRASRHHRRMRWSPIALIIPVSAAVAIMVFALFDFPFDRTELLLWCSIVFGVALGSELNRRRSFPASPTVTEASSFANRRRNFPASPIVTEASSFSNRRRSFQASPQQRPTHSSLLSALLSGWNPALLLLTLLAAAVGVTRLHSERQYKDIVLGIHARQWGAVEQAAAEARTTLCNISSSGIPYAYYQAMAQEYQKKPALATFRQALHDSPYNKQLLNDVARLEYTQNHNADTAIALLREAIRISPSFALSYFNLANVLYEERRIPEAIEVLKSFDIDSKQSASKAMVWHYHQGSTAHYYTDEVIDAERTRRDQMLQFLLRLDK